MGSNCSYAKYNTQKISHLLRDLFQSLHLHPQYMQTKYHNFEKYTLNACMFKKILKFRTSYHTLLWKFCQNSQMEWISINNKKCFLQKTGIKLLKSVSALKRPEGIGACSNLALDCTGIEGTLEEVFIWSL